jgi:hypothetical protein
MLSAELLPVRGIREAALRVRRHRPADRSSKKPSRHRRIRAREQNRRLAETRRQERRVDPENGSFVVTANVANRPAGGSPGLPFGASPASLNCAASDFAPPLSRECLDSRRASLDPSQPSERDRMHVFGSEAGAEDGEPLGRRATGRAGWPDFVRLHRLDDLGFRITDEASPPHEAVRRGVIFHIDVPVS